MIDITGIDKAVLLAALYNAAKTQGLGFLHYTPGAMTHAEAKEYVTNAEPWEWLYFDYIKGRVLKVDLSADMLDPHLYDRDNGAGATARVVASIRKAEGDSGDSAVSRMGEGNNEPQ